MPDPTPSSPAPPTPDARADSPDTAAPGQVALTAPRDDELLSAEFIRKLDQMALASKKIFAGRMKGERRSPRRGQSVEFADYRNYVPGDDLRFIDWNVYARLERLFLKLFMEEEDLHVSIVLDCSASMAYGEPDKLMFAKRVAAALGYITLRNQDRLSVHTAREALDLGVTDLRGRRAAHRLFTFLQGQAGDGRTNLRATLREFALRRRSGKGVIVLISDFLDKRGYDEALRYLQMGQNDVIVIHVLAPDEISPDLTEDLRLVDLEDGSVVEVSKSDVLARQYKATLQTFCDDLKETCLRRDMVYCYAVTEQPFEELVLKTLRARGVLA
ncbi:MAG: DUF58 domain-containing protein [Planctomycetota bacterium]